MCPLPLVWDRVNFRLTARPGALCQACSADVARTGEKGHRSWRYNIIMREDQFSGTQRKRAESVSTIGKCVLSSLTIEKRMSLCSKEEEVLHLRYRRFESRGRAQTNQLDNTGRRVCSPTKELEAKLHTFTVNHLIWWSCVESKMNAQRDWGQKVTGHLRRRRSFQRSGPL